MTDRIEDVCPRPERLPPAQSTQPLVPAIHVAAVYECQGPSQANAILGGELDGYVYQRDRQPNADLLAEKCRALHGAERAVITASGMGALAAALLAHAGAEDHVVVSNQLYGRSLTLFGPECQRLGIAASIVDTCDLAAVAAACQKRTRLIVAETITNPLLRVSDVAALARVAHEHGALLLIDNTFAGPAILRPLELGADLVMESLTKTMNGHSDVVLGMLAGSESAWQRVPGVLATWGLASAPFECWLAMRGIGTLALRIEKACANALAVARQLAASTRAAKAVAAVHYPGLEAHADHALAVRQFGERFGTIVTVSLRGGQPAVERFMAASGIPFCPSLGDLCTTLSHPVSTSHRSLPASEQQRLGIEPGTVRLSLGIESAESIAEGIAAGLAAAGG